MQAGETFDAEAALVRALALRVAATWRRTYDEEPDDVSGYRLVLFRLFLPLFPLAVSGGS